MSEGDVPPPPEGFELLTPLSGYARHVGPYFHRPDAGEGVEHALFIQSKHANALGLLHGGVLSAFLDSLMGAAVRQATGRRAVTVQMSVDFLQIARPGRWLLGQARFTDAADDLAHAQAAARVGEREIGHARGAFRLMGRGG